MRERKGASGATSSIGRATRGRAPARAREAGEGLWRDDPLEQAHGEVWLVGLTEDGEHHPACDARRSAPGPGRHVHEAEVVPHLTVRDAEGFGEGLAFVAPAEAQRRVPLGQQSDRLVPLVPDDVERDEPVLDEAPEEAERLGRRGGTEHDALGAEHLRAVRGQECDQEVRGRLARE